MGWLVGAMFAFILLMWVVAAAVIIGIFVLGRGRKRRNGSSCRWGAGATTWTDSAGNSWTGGPGCSGGSSCGGGGGGST